MKTGRRTATYQLLQAVKWNANDFMHLLSSHAPVSQLPDQDSSLPTLLLLAQALTVRSQLQTTTAVTARASNWKSKAAGAVLQNCLCVCGCVDWLLAEL